MSRSWSRLKHSAPATAERKTHSGTERIAPPPRRTKKRTVAATHAHTHSGHDGIVRRGEEAAWRERDTLCGSTRRFGGRLFARCFFFEAATASR